MYTVKDVMTPHVHTVEPDARVAEAMRRMKRLEQSSLIVPMPDGRYGIVTQRDIIGKVIAGGMDPDETPVSEICTVPIATVREDASLRECSARMMDLRVRRLPVLDGERNLVGIISETDIFIAVEERGWGPDALGSSKLRLIGTLARIRRTTVEDVMSKPVAMIEPDVVVAEALVRMASRGISSLIILPQPDRPVYGIITKRDIIGKVVAQNRDPRVLRVAAIMSAPIYTIAPHVTLPQCAARMVELGVRRLTVLHNDRPVGIISDTDIFRAVEGRRTGPLDRAPQPRPEIRHITRSRVHTAADVMDRQTLRVPYGTSLNAALETMEAHNIFSLLIEPPEPGGALGMVTQRDVVSSVVAQERDPEEMRVGEISSSPLVTVAPDTPIGVCSELMTKYNVRWLAVLEGDEVIGVVSDTDIFAAVEERGWEADATAQPAAPEPVPAVPPPPAVEPAPARPHPPAVPKRRSVARKPASKRKSPARRKPAAKKRARKKK